MTRPITPQEVSAAKVESIPDGVIEAFNELIVENWRDGSAVVSQDAAIQRILVKLNCTRETVFAKGWLDVEDAYRKAGWHVEYDKPGYNETYAASFTFSKKKFI